MYKLKTLIFTFAAFISASVSYASPSCIHDKTCIPLTIDNSSGQSLYIMIYGSSTHSFYNFIRNSYTANFSIGETIQSLEKGAKTLYLPVSGITGGARMYISTEIMNGIPDLATYPYIYDKIEMGWSAKGLAGWNTTSVDFFGMPIQLIQGSNKIGFKDDSTREKIIQDLQQNMLMEPILFDQRFFFGQGSEIARVFSPQHFYTSLPNAWAKTITQGLDELTRDDPNQGTGKYFNFNYGGTVFTNIRKPPEGSSDTVLVDANGQTQRISAINTGNAAAGQIHPVGNQFAGLLAAVINRGVLGNPKQWGENGMPNHGFPQYYYQGTPGYYRYNTYAKVLIEHSIDSKTYATAYDDYWHMDSSIQVGPANNEEVIVKILPF